MIRFNEWVTGAIASVERAAGDLLAQVALSRRIALGLLAALAAFAYLPGVLRLPPVDRTEIVYAETTRGMLARGDLIDARYGEVRHQFRPIGTFWLQMSSVAAAEVLFGGPARGWIVPYRLPSLAGVVIAIGATFWLLSGLVGNVRAFVAAAFVAAAPLVAVEAHLAITDGIALAASVVAMLCLLRLYCAEEGEPTNGLALTFWSALGIGVTLNALAVPILAVSVLLALACFDRNFMWIRRLHWAFGVPLAILLAIPWIAVRFAVDGVPFSGMAWSDILEALGGSQDMKWKAAPGTFTIASILGFMPGAALLYPAVIFLWKYRSADALPRFLLAWMIGYLVYLELISSKPALYTVQAMFPAFGAAVAIVFVPSHDPNTRVMPATALALPAPAVAILMLAIFGAIAWAAGVYTSPLVVLAAILVTALLTLGVGAQRSGAADAWFAFNITGFAALSAALFGIALPASDRIWPTTSIARAAGSLAQCAPGGISILGFREPSVIFQLGAAPTKTTPERMAEMAQSVAKPGLFVVEQRWNSRFASALAAKGLDVPQRIGCVEALNVMRGCPVSFSIYAPRAAKGCFVDEAYACKGGVSGPANATGRCD